MAARSLTISNTASGGGVLTLDDGRCYLILVEHQAISASWSIGQAVEVATHDGTRGGYTICSVDAPQDRVEAVVARESSHR